MRFLLLLISIHFSIPLISQTLSMSELISLRLKSPGAVDDFMLMKNWEMSESLNLDFGRYIKIKYSFNKSFIGNKVEAFLEVTIDQDISPQRAWSNNFLSYQFFTLKEMQTLTAQLKKLGYLEYDYQIKYEGVSRFYKSKSGKTKAILSTYSKKPDNSYESNYNVYIITLLPPD